MLSVVHVYIFPLICETVKDFNEVYELIKKCKWVGFDYL